MPRQFLALPCSNTHDSLDPTTILFPSIPKKPTTLRHGANGGSTAPDRHLSLYKVGGNVEEARHLHAGERRAQHQTVGRMGACLSGGDTISRGSQGINSQSRTFGGENGVRQRWNDLSIGRSPHPDPLRTCMK